MKLTFEEWLLLFKAIKENKTVCKFGDPVFASDNLDLPKSQWQSLFFVRYISGAKYPYLLANEKNYNNLTKTGAISAVRGFKYIKQTI